MQHRKITYLIFIVILVSVFGYNSGCSSTRALLSLDTLNQANKPTKVGGVVDTLNRMDMPPQPEIMDRMPNQNDSLAGFDQTLPPEVIDSIMPIDSIAFAQDSIALAQNQRVIDSIASAQKEARKNIPFAQDTTRVRKPRKNLTEGYKSSFISEIIETTNKDSLIMDMKIDKMFLYQDVKVDYATDALEAEIVEIDMNTNYMYAKGTVDSVENKYLKSKYKDASNEYEMDSISYNLKSKKGKIFGAYFNDKQAEGYVHGEAIKKIDDIMNVKGGKYTSCDHEHPHFYLASTKAQYITEGEARKIVIGLSYLVIEDVVIPLPIPFGFFPIMSERSSGLIFPSFGEENLKGFYLRDGGYYQVVNDHWDAAVVGGIYTLGSWNVRLSSNYSVRYKFNGQLSFDYASDKLGNKGTPNYQEMSNYKLLWSHSQSPKASPGSTFSASVNFASSGYNKFDGTLEDYTSSQTNSSISYSKTWMGTPFSMSANIQQSQNNRDSTLVLSMPNIVFTVSKIYPFKRRNPVGAQRWYEKLSLNYTGTFNNTMNIKEDLMFTSDMFNNMKYGMRHSAPVSTSFNLFKYISVSPNFKYDERWYFDKIDKEWDAQANQVVTDTITGFNRIYDYSGGVSFSTIVYGMFNFKKGSKLEAIRHMVTPNLSFSYKPNFGDPSYGYYKTVQTDSEGTLETYSPFQNGIYGVPGRGESAAISFGLSNNIEMKLRNDKDTTGSTKVAIFESLSVSGSYNFIADSMKLSPFSLSARTTLFKKIGINMSAQLDPYVYTEEGVRTKDLAWANGSLGRITNFSLSFGYSFRSAFGYSDGTSSAETTSAPANAPLQGSGEMGQTQQTREDQIIANAIQRAAYYNFHVPWNLSFNYQFQLQNTGLSQNVIQTLSLNGGISLTPKWAITLSSGFDFSSLELTPGTISIVRDLHCWQMSFSWVPTGFRKSWTFNINVKSSTLQDLKYKKTSSFTDNFYNTY